MTLVSASGFAGSEARLHSTEFVQGLEVELSEEPTHVISMIPGIRDIGAWIDQLDFYSQQNALRIKAEPVVLSRVNSLLFLLRVGSRRRELEVLTRLLTIRLLYPAATHSILAHSYGTEMLSKVVYRIPLRYDAIFLCGAVARRHAADHFLSKTPKLINDCSPRDMWPLVAETLNPIFYEATGTHGMRVSNVRDRFHNCGHGGYLSTGHFEKHIVPVLFRKAEVRHQQSSPTWKSHLPNYIRRSFLIALIVVVSWIIWRHYWLML